MSIEEPDADKLDQLRSVTLDDAEDRDYLDPPEFPLEVNPVDFAEQHRSVPLGDDAEG